MPTSGESAQQSSTPAAAAPEFRYGPGDNVPNWLVGKTAGEAAQLSAQMYQQLLAQEQRTQLGPPPVTYQQVNTGLPSPDWSTNPDAAASRLVDQRVAPALNQQAQMLGQWARASAEVRYKDDFRRWGPEIDLALSAIPPEQRSPQVVDWIVNGVRGQHSAELANEAAERRVQELIQGGTLRPQSADAASAEAANRVDLEKLPPGYRAHMQMLGVTPAYVDEQLRKVYPNMPLAKAREKWMAMAAKNEIISDGKGYRSVDVEEAS